MPAVETTRRTFSAMLFFAPLFNLLRAVRKLIEPPPEVVKVGAFEMAPFGLEQAGKTKTIPTVDYYRRDENGRHYLIRHYWVDPESLARDDGMCAYLWTSQENLWKPNRHVMAVEEVERRFGLESGELRRMFGPRNGGA